MYHKKYLYPDDFLQRNVRILVKQGYEEVSILSLLNYLVSKESKTHEIHYLNYFYRIINTEYHNYKIEKKQQ